MYIAIPATTAAATSNIDVSQSQYFPPVTIIANGLAGTETVNILIANADKASYAPLYDNGVQVQLTATNNAVTLYGPGQYQLSKSVTAAAVSVAVSSMVAA